MRVRLKFLGDMYTDGKLKRIFKKVRGSFDYRILNYVKYMAILQVKVFALKY